MIRCDWKRRPAPVFHWEIAGDTAKAVFPDTYVEVFSKGPVIARVHIEGVQYDIGEKGVL
jgi:hypothetical protein